MNILVLTSVYPQSDDGIEVMNIGGDGGHGKPAYSTGSASKQA